MKSQTRILLILIFFAVFFIFSNTDSLAFTYNGFEIPDFPEDYNDYKYHYIRYNFNAGCFDLVLTNNKIVTSYPACSSCYNQGYREPYGCTHLVGVHGYRYKPGEKDYWYFHKDFSNLAWVYYDDDQPYIYADTDVYESDGTLYFKANSIENYYNYVIDNFLSVKNNLFELNLTDLDFGNTVHKFNISTFDGSSYRDELMNYYINNNPYFIYLTDYQRIMTYGEQNNDSSYQYGSYMLSGYIDFFKTDTSFAFYYPPTNEIRYNDTSWFTYQKTNEKQTYSDISDFVSRFYFKLVYSEDSNDPYSYIYQDNGSLKKYTEGMTEPENVYFIGGNTNIRYAKYHNFLWLIPTNVMTLSDNFYYVGYLGEDGKQDISETPFYVYNFSFAGGTTKLFFLNSSTYVSDIQKTYNDSVLNYVIEDILQDTSDGSSYTQGDGYRTSTFQPRTSYRKYNT